MISETSRTTSTVQLNNHNNTITNNENKRPLKKSLLLDQQQQQQQQRVHKKAKTVHFVANYVDKLVIRPSDYVLAAFKANGVTNMDKVQASVASKFIQITPEMMQAYTPELLNCVRQNDLVKLQQLHHHQQQEEGGTKLINCCNKFGESLLHLACRRSYHSIVKYLLEEGQVTIHIRDDYHRTPLHDACWTVEPNFALVDMLIRKAPEHLVMEDVRGFTPFDYVRTEHWGKWLRFLWERKDLLRLLPTTTTTTTTSTTTTTTIAETGVVV